MTANKTSWFQESNCPGILLAPNPADYSVFIHIQACFPLFNPFPPSHVFPLSTNHVFSLWNFPLSPVVHGFPSYSSFSEVYNLPHILLFTLNFFQHRWVNSHHFRASCLTMTLTILLEVNIIHRSSFYMLCTFGTSCYFVYFSRHLVILCMNTPGPYVMFHSADVSFLVKQFLDKADTPMPEPLAGIFILYTKELKVCGLLNNPSAIKTDVSTQTPRSYFSEDSNTFFLILVQKY